MASVSSLGLTGLPAPPSLQWAIFDRCRGLEEGREHEKILFFYPGTVTLAKQLQVTGLAEALLAFCASFGVDEAPSFSACQRHVVVYEEPEERIIMLIMADRQLLGSSVSHMQMRALLRDAHGMFCALHGPIRDLILDDGPTGATHASALLCALFGSICDHFLHGKHHGTLKELQNPLSRWTGVAHQPLNYALTLALQSFVLRATMPPAAAPAAACVADMVLLYKDSMLWSTLPRSDTHVLYLLALRSIIPACKASLKSAALTQIASAFAGAGAAGAAGAAAAAAAAAGSASASRPLARGLHVPSHPLLSEGCWMAGADGWARCRGAHLLTPRPQSSGSAPPMFIPTALPCGVLPVVRLDGGRGGWAPLACYNCNGLIVLLLLPEACALDDMGAVLRRTQDLVREHLGELPPILARLMQQVGKGHVPGYLYSVQDRASGTARASPSGKVSGWLSRKTLGLLSEAQESALALHTLQEPPLPAQHQEQQQQQQEEECTMSTLPHAAAAASRAGDLGPLPSPGRQQVELVTCGSSEGWVMTNESGTVASHFAWESRPTESLADVQHDAQTFLRDHLVGAMLPA